MRFPGLILVVVVIVACSRTSDKPVEQNTGLTPVVQPKDDAIVIADQQETDSIKGSRRAKAEGKIGSTAITVRYHSPAVRGRIIWGGVVPLDQVWVTGAHMATKVEFSENVTIAGKPVPAGAYGFFSFPGKDSWILVLNGNWEQHLTDEYDESLDVLRMTVKPAKRETSQERLQYSIIEETPTQGKLVVRWEWVEVALPITVMP
jgi:Protein of unknown function (DUF2911)